MRFVIQAVPGKAERWPRTGSYSAIATTPPGAAWTRIARPGIRQTCPSSSRVVGTGNGGGGGGRGRAPPPPPPPGRRAAPPAAAGGGGAAAPPRPARPPPPPPRPLAAGAPPPRRAVRGADRRRCLARADQLGQLGAGQDAPVPVVLAVDRLEVAGQDHVDGQLGVLDAEGRRTLVAVLVVLGHCDMLPQVIGIQQVAEGHLEVGVAEGETGAQQ